MAKFDAATAVEVLEYDFTKFGGSKGDVQEPSTGQVNEFFRSVRHMMGQVREIQAAMGGEDEIHLESDMDEAELAAQMDKVDEASSASAKFQAGLVESIAVLCGAERSDPEDEESPLVGGAPSFQDLNRLPFRVLQAFNQWLIGEIRPKADGTRPSPQDRKPKGGSSRRGTST